MVQWKKRKRGGALTEKNEEARQVFEKLAQRLDQLWQKDKLTVAEQREVQLILNNAMIVNEILEGKRPEELTGLDD